MNRCLRDSRRNKAPRRVKASRNLTLAALALLAAGAAQAGTTPLATQETPAIPREEILNQLYRPAPGAGANPDLSAHSLINAPSPTNWELPDASAVSADSDAEKNEIDRSAKPPIAPLPPAVFTGSAALLSGATVRLFRKLRRA